MPLNLVPRVLLYVEAVAEHGSIQAASRAIGISASAIDRQIVLLEDKLDLQLFDRRSTGMDLSAAGEMFVVLSRRWRDDENRVLSDVKQMHGVEVGLVRLATMDSLTNGPLPQILARIGREYPRVEIEVEIMTPDEALVAIDEGLADIVLGFNLKASRDLHVLWSDELPLVCVASPDHPVSERETISIKDVRAYPLVVQSAKLAIRRILEARHTWLFSDTRPPVVTNSLQLLKQMAVSGSHIALTSELDASSELLDGSLIAIPISEQKISSQSIGLVVSVRRTLPRICTTVSEIVAEEIASCIAEVRGVAAARQVARPTVRDGDLF
ncbi:MULTISPECIES: LysR family transcriptional regulator [Falsihalocynthiibacter]|uniref:LysR family transcriptional regulator n=1 Tax=Falsihalocynthiibacter TaxID=2854182 RepID=UPI003003551D